MNVEVQELMGEDWTRWQGYLVNGVYPLGRHIGGSGQSGVFETRTATAGEGRMAIKLIPATEGSAELQLARWAQARSLSHPHLLPLRDAGACELDGVPYLYVVMAYAEQTLAQLLEQRALTVEEAREMLPPVLDALAYLHGQDLVQGSCKPANVLVIGDQLTLASDTIRQAGDSRPGPASVFEAPEDREQGVATASDIWALGISLLEALTRRAPNSLTYRSPVTLPADVPAEFRDVVARCLSADPRHRPRVADLVAWLAGQLLPPIPAAAMQPSAWQRPPAPVVVPAPTPTLAPALPSEVELVAVPAPAPTFPSLAKPVAWIPVGLVAAVVLTLGWTGGWLLRSHATPAAGDQESAPLAVPVPADGIPVPAPAGAAPTATPAPSPDRSEPTVLHQELPAVSRSAARTLHGQVKVTVRAVLDPDGSVSRVLADRSGRSRYLHKLAVQAAKQWTFAPSNGGGARQVAIEFAFTREQTTGRALPLP